MAEFEIGSSEPINFLDSTTDFVTQEYDSIPSSDPIKFGTELETKLDLVLVLQPGSANLRIGRVTDTQPEIVPHIIAYKQNQTCTQLKSADETLLFNLESENINTYSETRKLCLGEVSSFLQEVRPKGNVTLHPKRLREKNETIEQQELTEESEITSTTLTPPNRFYTGEDALHLSTESPYSIHWPIKRGRFNITTTQSVEMVLQCLEDIWGGALAEMCGTDNFGEFKVLLLIQNLFDRQEVKHMVDVLLIRLKFGSVAVQQSSVCAVYSSGISSGCVVDVGDQTISVGCIEDGISNPNTRLVLNYGGNDVTRAFWWLINQSGFPYKNWDISNRVDRCLMEELKEDICHLDMELTGIREFPFRVNPPDSNAIQFRIYLCDEPVLAPLTFFCPRFITMVSSEHVKSQKIQPPHPEDYLDDVTLFETKKDLVSGVHTEKHCEQDTELQLPTITKLLHSKSIGGTGSSSKLLSLDEAVHLSISCSNEQNKQKLYKSIVVTGAGFLFPKGLTFLQNRIKETLPDSLKKIQVEIFTPLRGDVSTLSWLGGTVVASLDTFNEVWIKREEWLTSGVRLIRERSPFIW